jgi:hypothetical protein
MSETFDKKWKNFLKSQGSFTKAVDYSYKLWKTKYQGVSKVKPQETFQEKLMIPGKIYSCMYANLDEVKTNKFVDHWPIIFSMGSIVHEDNKVYETGLDLNIIPPQIRVQVISKLHDFYSSVISQNEKSINEGKKGKKKIDIDFKKAQVVLSGTGFEKAYCIFVRDKIGKVKVVDYTDWPAMSTLYTQGVRGIPIDKIWGDYVKSMGKNQGEKKSLIKRLMSLGKNI